MPVKVPCPNASCKKTILVPETAAGRSVRCPQCKQPFTVPADLGPCSQAAERTRTPEARETISSPATTRTAEAGPPQRIGRFVVRSRLGAGAFGAVYRAHDPQLDREVALKVPHASSTENPQAVERFLREAKASARLRHPHIVPVFDAGRDGAHYYIAAAFIDGRTLAHAIDEEKLDFRQAAQVVQALAEALAYAHRQGIVHRDVKPANVMLKEAGTRNQESGKGGLIPDSRSLVPFLMDFGLAHRHDAADKLTQEGAIVGTPAYMAPEQAQGQTGKPLPASDQYSLGVVLYELLTGQTPFSGPAHIVLFNAVNQELPAPRSLRPEIPLDLETICLKAMAKRPEDRYAGCQELADDLRRWLEEWPILARPLGPMERLRRWYRRAPKLAWTVTAAASCLFLLVLVEAVGAYGLWSKAKTEFDTRKQTEQLRLQEASAKERARRSALAAEEAERKAREKQKEKEVAFTAASRDTIQAQEALAQAAESERQKAATLRESQKSRDETDRLRKEGDKTEKSEEEKRKDAEERKMREKESQEKRDLFEKIRKKALKGHEKSIQAVAYSPDGKWMASGDAGGVLKVWDAATGLARHTLQHDPGVNDLAFSPDGRHLVSAGENGLVQVCHLATGKVALRLEGHRGQVRCAVFRADGQELATGGQDGFVILWDPVTGENVRTFRAHARPVFCLTYSPDGKRLASGSGIYDASKKKWQSGEICVWHAATGKSAAEPIVKGLTREVTGLAFNYDGQFLFAATSDHGLSIWDPATGEQNHILNRPVPLNDHVRFQPVRFVLTPDRRGLIIAIDRNLLVWDLTAQPLVPRPLPAHAGRANCVAVSPDGGHVLSGDSAGNLGLWDLARRQEVKP